MARAAPLSPEARRASIVAATLPLLRIYGRSVTTSQIAMAAGVAEGTLFRVFADKDALIEAAVASAFDPAPGEAELARIDRALPLRDKLIAALEILQRRVSQIWQLISMLALPAPPPERSGQEAGPLGSMTRGRRPPPHVDDTRLRAQLVALFEPHRDEIRVEPEQAARLFRALAFAGTHPRIIDQPLTPHELVSLLLDGITARDEEI